MSAKMPGSGSVAEPGLVGTAPGSGEIMWPPVSVCHHVSTIGQRPPPTVSWYHIHASGLIGSPTVPRMRSDERSYFFGRVSPLSLTWPTFDLGRLDSFSFWRPDILSIQALARQLRRR